MFIDWTFKLPFSPVTGSLVPVLMFTPNPFCGCVPSCSFACMSANPTHHCPPHWQRDGPALHDRIFRFDVGIDHVCCYSSDVRADSGKRGGDTKLTSHSIMPLGVTYGTSSTHRQVLMLGSTNSTHSFPSESVHWWLRAIRVISYWIAQATTVTLRLLVSRALVGFKLSNCKVEVCGHRCFSSNCFHI